MTDPFKERERQERGARLAQYLVAAGTLALVLVAVYQCQREPSAPQILDSDGNIVVTGDGVQVTVSQGTLAPPTTPPPASHPPPPSEPVDDPIPTRHPSPAPRATAVVKRLGGPAAPELCAELRFPEMVAVPGGRFMLGSPSQEFGRGTAEGQREVTVEEFAIGKYEVTFSEYACFAAQMGHPLPDDEVISGGHHPVVKVTWSEAQAFVDWLAQTSGQAFRLPTEEEWEYAARAGSTEPNPWRGDQGQACKYANIYDASTPDLERGFNPKNTRCNDGWAGTAPVGQFLPNAFGLHDMLGNVWEFTATCSSLRQGPNGRCAEYIMRGCSWRCGRGDPTCDELRYAQRRSVSPTVRAADFGFRVAISADR